MFKNSHLRLPQNVLVPMAAAGAIVTVGFWLVIHQQTSFLIAGIILCCLFGVYTVSREMGIYCALTFLIFLGDIRRIWSLFNGYGKNDVLVLIGPAFVALITIPVFMQLRLKDTRSKFALAFVAIMLLQVLNPGQGGIVIGLSGLALTLPPLLWFWVGQAYGDEKMIRVVTHRIIVPAALIASCLGMYQTFIGIPFWQEGWIQYQMSQHLDILRIGNGIRAFGFSTVISEYNNLLLFACYICAIGGIAGRRVLFLPLFILLPSLVLGSSRGPILHLLLGCVLAYAFKSRKKSAIPLPVRLILAVVVGFGGLALVLSASGGYSASKGSSSAADAELAHQVNGLAHPLDKKYSTAGLHRDEIGRALLNSFRHPIGYGTGTSYFGLATAEGDESRLTSEFDLTDTFVNLGIPGGLIYIGFIISVIMAGAAYSKFGQRDLSLVLFVMLIPQIGQWFFAGEYGNGPAFFFLIGSMVHLVNLEEAKKVNKKRVAKARTIAPEFGVPARLGGGAG